jgi:acyl-coenzyme A synthetase/AMP-(fatty) acid ligase
VETAALDIPGVSAAVALPPGPDNALVVYVVGDTTPGAVLAALGDRVEPARVPDRCVVLPGLPTTANGKVDKDALRAVSGAAR